MTAISKAYAFLRQARDDGNENTDALHPTLAWRLYLALLELWTNYGFRSVTIESAARTELEQRRLYAAYKAGTFPNLVANPDREISNTPIGKMRGSWHMVQRDGFAHAVDLTRPGHRLTWPMMHKALDSVGLWHGVPTEPWHAQAMLSSGWVPGPTPPAEPELPDLTMETDMIIQPCYDPDTQQQVVLWHQDDHDRPCFDVLDKSGRNGTPIDNLVALCSIHFVRKG